MNTLLTTLYLRLLRDRKKFSVWAMSFVLLISTVYAVLHALSSPHIVTYDSQHTIHLFSEQMATRPLSEEQREALSKRFSQVLAKTLHDYAKGHQAIIVKPTLIIAGGQDITSDIEHQLSTNMKEATK